jgi:hypothetical protein
LDKGTEICYTENDVSSIKKDFEVHIC